jgi:hypothetical protein
MGYDAVLLGNLFPITLHPVPEDLNPGADDCENGIHVRKTKCFLDICL